MKKLCVLLALALFCAQPLWAAPVKNVDAPTAEKLLKGGQDIYLLDVRTPQEYFEKRLSGAHLIPIERFLSRIAEVPKDRPLLIYCAVGHRSSQVAEYLAKQGYPEVYDMRGGIEAWEKLYGLPVLRGAP